MEFLSLIKVTELKVQRSLPNDVGVGNKIARYLETVLSVYTAKSKVFINI